MNYLNYSFIYILHFLLPTNCQNSHPKKALRSVLQSAFFMPTFLSSIRAKSQSYIDWCHHRFLDSNLYYILRTISSLLSLSGIFVLKYTPEHQLKSLVSNNLSLPEVQLLPFQLYPRRGGVIFRNALPWFFFTLPMKLHI